MQRFQIGFVVPQHEGGSIITERVAARQITQTIEERQDPGLAAKNTYRNEFVKRLRAACMENEEGTALAKKFLILAHTLEHSKALALPAVYTASSENDTATSDASWKTTVNEPCALGGKPLHNQSDALRHRNTQAGIIHPLIIAILSFRMGGAINAVCSGYAHQWRLPGQTESAMHVQNFHMEGDVGDMFDDHRVTLV